MRILNNLTKIALTIAAAATMQSCLKDDGISYSELIPNAVVTIKPVAQNGYPFYMQLDDSTVIYPSNLNKSPFGDKEVRAFINYKKESEEKGAQVGFINWSRELLTKNTVESLGSDEKNTAKYGNDPVALVNAFPTVCEDGYLTLRFRTLWGAYINIKHEVNLVTGVDPSDPYLVEFRHNRFADAPEVQSDAYVAFRLNTLPDTQGKTVKLKVRYRNWDGETKVVEFDYKTRPGDGK